MWGLCGAFCGCDVGSFDAKKGLHLGLHSQRKPSDFPPEPCRWVLYCWRLIWSRLCGICGSLLDWSLSSLEHFVISSSSSVTCKQRPLPHPPLFLYSPEPTWAFPGSPHPLPHFVFILKCFILLITCYFGFGLQRRWPVLVLPPSLALTHNPWSHLHAWLMLFPLPPQFLLSG